MVNGNGCLQTLRSSFSAQGTDHDVPIGWIDESINGILNSNVVIAFQTPFDQFSKRIDVCSMPSSAMDHSVSQWARKLDSWLKYPLRHVWRTNKWPAIGRTDRNLRKVLICQPFA
jgi:hypothetical protein